MINQASNSVTWNANSFSLSVQKEPEGARWRVLDDAGGERIIEEIVADFPLDCLALLAGSVYPRIHKLSEGSVKVYFHPRLLGGILDQDEEKLAKAAGIQTDSNEEIAGKIRKNVQGYPNVEVSIEMHLFGDNTKEKLARKISVSLSKGQSVATFIQGVAALFGYKKERFQGTLNNNAVALAILGSDDPEAIRELGDAFERGEHLDLYIAMDLSDMHPVFAQSAGHKVASGGCTVM